MSGPTYTGWMFTDATRLMVCPRCGAAAGEDCRQPGGRQCRKPHGERVVALREAHPEAVKLASRKAGS